MNIVVDYDFILTNSVKLLVSTVLGALIGAEREYKGRNIGFRTIILITLGSTLFTILSAIAGDQNDPARIAANIVTGVGFLGAGAIFREGASVKGMTTASLIWISAAIGMACGFGQYEFAFLVTATVLFVLLGFASVQKSIDKYSQERVYKISFSKNPDLQKEIENKLKSLKLKGHANKFTKGEEKMEIEYEVRGSESAHIEFITYLYREQFIQQFEV
ncbi:MAG: MgtC/SapB family protein [Bacteroidia bacterium]|jgi:putative Mg2+ transporter-C (MgtC) family protein|nr:MgtC/SapB family protein [Bacteroidia bacterium]